MDNNGNGKLDALLKRELALKAAIAAEKVKRQRHKEKDRARLVEIVGAALLDEAARVPDFELMLKQTLRTAVTDERAHEFLKGQGWL